MGGWIVEDGGVRGSGLDFGKISSYVDFVHFGAMSDVGVCREIFDVFSGIVDPLLR